MRVFYQYTLLLSLVLILHQSFAQNDSTLLKKKEFILKYPVTSILGDIRTASLGISLGLEVVGERGWSFSQELGYMFDRAGEKVFEEGNEEDEMHEVRLTSELRKYLFARNLNPSSGLFLSTEWDNKLTRASYVLQGERAYFNAYRSSLTLNIGGKVFWSPEKSGRVTLELMIGAGLEYLADDPGSYTSEDKLFFPTETLYPWVNFDFKIGYLLRK